MATPKPTPTELKLIRGNPGRRPLPKNEFKPEVKTKIPTAPKYLGQVGKKEWRRVAKHLIPVRLLTDMDLVSLAAYCEQFQIFVECAEKIKGSGLLIKSPNGYPIQSPLVTTMQKAQAEMRKWIIEFGMTPSSRTNVKVPEKKEYDPQEEFLKRR